MAKRPVRRLPSVSAAIRRRAVVFRNRGFRRLIAGRTVSVLGDGLYTVAAMWLVYELSGSTAYTGLAGALTRAPGVFKFLVGPIVDRARLERALTYSEVAQAGVVLIVPVATALGHLRVAVVLLAMPLLAIANLVSGPAQNATLPRLVDDDRLVSANSTFSVATSTVDAASRAISGVLIALVGAVALYVVDAATFLVAALLFAGLTVPGGGRADDSLDLADYRADLREGFELLADSVAGLMLVAVLFANFMASATFAVLPAFAAGLGGPETYGLLLAATTVGTVAGAVTASAVDSLPFGWTTIGGMVAAGLLWVGGVALAAPVATAALFAGSRVPLGVYNVSVLATFQTGVPDDLLGRVTATTSSASNLVAPAGLLLGGIAGEVIGVRIVMVAGGVGFILMAAYWLAIPSLRRFGPPTAVTPGEFA